MYMLANPKIQICFMGLPADSATDEQLSLSLPTASA